MDWQEITALGIVAFTALFLAWRLVRTFCRPKNQPKNCGHGCGCGAEEELTPKSHRQTSP